MWILLISIILSTYASAGVLTTDAPATTPRALLPRADSVFGYYSAGKKGSETIWNAYAVDTDQYSFTTSGDYYRFCSKGYSCYMSYSCSSGYIFYESSSISTSSYCGLYTSTCISDLLYSSFGDYDPMTQYWCLSSSYTGIALYQTTPEFPGTFSDISTLSISPTDPTVTTTPLPKPPPTVVPEPSSAKSNTGIIVGGVVGGIALIGIIGLVAILLLRRKRAQTTAHQHAPQGQPQMPIGLPEKTAQPTVITVDPHASAYYGAGAMSPVTPASPAPQYAAYTAPHGVELASERA